MGLKTASPPGEIRWAGLGGLLLALVVILTCLLRYDFLPGQILFSNDGPLGRLATASHRLPERFTGSWADLNSVGVSEGAAPPDISFCLLWLLKPFAFSKLYLPVSLTILGVGAWCFFRKSGLAPPACLLGGLAAALNSGFFSTACWGVAAHPLAFGMGFFAMAALADPSPRLRWLKVVLAGLAVGMGVSEGADVGAILSLYITAFIIWQASIAEGPRLRQLATGIGRLTLVAITAALLAAQAVSGLVATNISGVAGTGQDSKTRAQRWDWATQWSLPKREALGLAVPGLFGYRFDTPEGGSYWGTVGRASAWDQYVANGRQGPPPTGFTRYAGSGYYAGVSVLLLALWAVARSARGKDSGFSRAQRQWIWFWVGTGVVSLLLAFGRHAPFYRWVYALPYCSTIRNPIKFLHLTSFALVVLFGYGVDGLWRNYMRPTLPSPAARWAGVLAWWGKASGFEKRWLKGCFLTLGLGLAAWAAYALSRQSLIQYLATVQVDDSSAPVIADFSIRQVGWFELGFGLSTTLMALILSGAFVGRRAPQGAALLGFLVVADLARADQPWVAYWDFDQKYAGNPILDLLRDRPYEHRVALLAFSTPPELDLLKNLYRIEWIQQLFPYYNIQSYDVVDMPRKPEDIAAFEKAFGQGAQADPAHLVARCWQLTNTRYLLGIADFEESMNDQVDPVLRRLRRVERFRIVPKPGVRHAAEMQQLTAVPAADGPFALFEFTGALPRAGLYTHWQFVTNAQSALDQLTLPAFDPEHEVLVDGAAPAPPAANPNPIPGRVEFVSYTPKHLVLRSDASTPAVLLLNDRFDPDWKVEVDGTPRPLLRCNYLMRGVYLEAGRHTVQFHFQRPVIPLYISLTTTILGLLTLGVVLVREARQEVRKPLPATHSRPRQASSSLKAVLKH